MSNPRTPFRDALTIAAAKRLAEWGVRWRVNAFLVVCVWGLVLVSLLAMAAAFVAASIGVVALAESPVVEVLEPGWAITLALVGGVAYIEAIAFVRESLSRVRYAIHTSPVRGLWIALDVPLTRVVLVERGALQAVRVAVGSLVVITTSVVLLAHGAAAAAVGSLTALIVLAAGETACHFVALTNAVRAPTSRWSGMLGAAMAALGLVGGFALSVTARAPREPVGSGMNLSSSTAALAIATVAIVAGTVLSTMIWRSVTMWRAHPDIPLRGLGTDPGGSPTALERRLPAVVGSAVAKGTGTLRLQPLQRRALHTVLFVAAAAIGLRLGGAAVAETNIGSVGADEALTRAAAVVAAAVGIIVGAGFHVTAAQSVRLWHYRILWELGGRAPALWAGHIVGALAQTVILVSPVVLAVAVLIGTVPWHLLTVAVAVVLGEALAGSLFVRSVRTDGDPREQSIAMAITGYGLMAPAVVLALLGGTWVYLIVGYVALLLIGGLTCFTLRLRTLPVAVVP